MNDLAIAEFEKLPRGPYLVDRWLAQRQVPTPLGPFTIQLQTHDTNPPDNEMLARASELIRIVDIRGEQILDVVYGHYLLIAKEGNWLESCGVARGLDRAEIPMIVDRRLLVVSRHLSWKEHYNSVVFVDPPWDTEHKLILGIRDESIATVNDSMFRLESQVLRWVRP